MCAARPLVLALALAACGATPDACPPLRVEIELRGHGALGDEAERIVRAEVGEVPSDALGYYHLFHRALPRGRLALLDAYRDRGFADAEVALPEVERGRGAVRIAFTVEEGERVRVGAIRVAESEPTALAPVAPSTLSGVTSGAWLSASALERAREEVAARYEDEGYARVRVRVERERTGPGRVDLEVHIVRGAVYSVEALDVIDAEDGVLAGALALTDLAAGERYSRRRVEAARRALERAYPERAVLESVTSSSGVHRVRVRFLLVPRE